MTGARTAHNRRVAAFFDAEAVRYDSAYDRRSGRVVQARLAAVLRLLPATPGDVLDAGMGGGRLCLELERRGWNVAGVDASAAMVALARRRLPNATNRLLEAQLEELPFPDERFDVVVATGVLEFVDDLETALTEVRRTLRPGGSALVSFPNYRALPSRWRGRVVYPVVRLAKRFVRFGRPVLSSGPRHPLSRKRFESALEGAELRIQRVEVVGVRGLARAAATRIEGPPSRLGMLFGLQLVFETRRV
jgi:ubiquinone/menaquinone biosynthesis C-methylase UbiE